jgi:hypothetical protein
MREIKSYCHDCDEFISPGHNGMLGIHCPKCGTQTNFEILFVTTAMRDLMQKWHKAYIENALGTQAATVILPDFTEMAQERFRDREKDA